MNPADFEPDAHEGEGCPVAALGRALHVLSDRLEEIDDLKNEEERKHKASTTYPSDGMPAHPEAAWLDMDDRIDALRFALSAHRARSLAGCLCQLAQAGSLMDDLYDEIEAPTYEVKRAKRTFERLMFSIAMHLEEVAGVTLEDVGMGEVMSRYLNPWERPEATMARLREERPAVGASA